MAVEIYVNREVMSLLSTPAANIQNTLRSFKWIGAGVLMQFRRPESHSHRALAGDECGEGHAGQYRER